MTPAVDDSVGVVAAPARSAERTSRSTRSATRIAAIGLQALDVEAEPLGVRPDVRVVDPALVGVDGVVEAAQNAPCRAAASQRWASGTARGWRAPEREVAEDVAHGRVTQALAATAQRGHVKSA